MAAGSFVRTVALRYLRARRQEGLVSVIAVFSFLGIMLGVATLIIVLSIMNGFRAQLIDRIVGVNPHITVAAPAGGGLRATAALRREIEAIPGVGHTLAAIEAQALASAGPEGIGVLVKGVSARDLDAFPRVRAGASPGALERFAHESGVLLGNAVAGRLGVTVGGTIKLVAPKPGPRGAILAPNDRRFPVIGLFAVGLREIDASLVLMPVESARRFFGVEGEATHIGVMLTDPLQSETVRDRVKALTPEGVQVRDWRQSNASLFGALKIERVTMFLILTLIILVAAFNIVSSMMMLVQDKGRDIGILRTMGASRGEVARIFLLTGGLIGVTGTLGGFALGAGVAVNLPAIQEAIRAAPFLNPSNSLYLFLTRMPAIVDWREVGAVLAMALTLSVAATIYPSLRAARLDPVDSLRGE